ncbi:hypothetical protein LTR53_008781 [Teratosphaeriaceae sp. CCFEE 6253]|nr:hypothetical protein LTR53_008781 [Teratosphaeriaceae sp. CCFEE 6253]
MADYDEKRGSLRLTVSSLPSDTDGYDGGQQKEPLAPRPSGMASTSRALQDWTTPALMVSYFVFSTALYTLIPDGGRKVFWFLYLTVATLVAGITALEAYDGLTLLNEARKAIKKTDGVDGKFKTAEDQVPGLHLIFDAGQEDGLVDADSITCMADELVYPEDKVTITVLRTSGLMTPTLDYIGNGKLHNLRVLTVPVTASTSAASRVAYCLALDSHQPAISITGLFAADERPHPHAARHAVEKLLQDAKIDIVQGRDIKVSTGSFLDNLITIEHDLTHALCKPGGSLTWGFSMPTGTNAYWRTEALRAAATSTAIVRSEGLDLPYAALARNLRTVFDLKVISYSSCAPNLVAYCREQVALARRLAIATGRYTTLAFKRHRTGAEQTRAKWAPKKRFSVIYTLPLSRLVTHAILQYFCMSLALLCIATPHSAADLARTLYFPFPVSIWFVAIGVLCLVATVAMAYMARSEFVSFWTAPLMVLTYPLLVFFHAGVDVYGQASAIVT